MTAVGSTFTTVSSDTTRTVTDSYSGPNLTGQLIKEEIDYSSGISTIVSFNADGSTRQVDRDGSGKVIGVHTTAPGQVEVFELHGITLSDGATATGEFALNVQTYDIVTLNIATSSGMTPVTERGTSFPLSGIMPGLVYDSAGPNDAGPSGIGFDSGDASGNFSHLFFQIASGSGYFMGDDNNVPITEDQHLDLGNGRGLYERARAAGDVIVSGANVWASGVSGNLDDLSSPLNVQGNVVINQPGTYTVLDTNNHAINALIVGNATPGAVTLEISHVGLEIAGGSISNSGIIQLDSVAGETGSSLVIAADTRLSGGGEILLGALSGDGVSQVIADPVVSTPVTLNNIDNTITGSGHIGNDEMILVNRGTVSAHGGTLVVDTGPNTVTNFGTMTASDGSTLTIDSAVANKGTLSATSSGHLSVDANVGNSVGTIAADDGFVFVQSLSGGGSATISDGGSIEFGGAANAHVSFGTGGGTLTLDSALAFRGDVSGFTTGDSFDFTGIASTGAKLKYLANAADPHSGGTLQIRDATNTVVGKVAVVGDYTATDFTAQDDGHGHLLVQHHAFVIVT